MARGNSVGKFCEPKRKFNASLNLRYPAPKATKTHQLPVNDPVMHGLLFQDIAHVNRKEAAQLLANVKHAEKKTFPRFEAFDFDTELKKRNTHLVCAVEAKEHQKSDVCPVAYLVYARTGRTALLHKICVVQSHRRKGIGRQMMAWLLPELANNGCENVQLWVDEARAPARALYVSLGFRQIDYVADYYSPGRAGMKMILHLQSG